MSILLHGDCLEEMKGLDDNSVDLIFCDLPYGQTSCSWDCCLDLEKFWVEIMRIKKLNTPLFFTTTTKFGVSLIQSAPKKCPFRYDLIWVKSASAGFLSAKKMPLRKHEMIYVFYEKLPFYDLSSHKHKFIQEGGKGMIEGNKVYEGKKVLYRNESGKYDPPLPVSVVKEESSTLYNNKGKSTTPLTKHGVVGQTTGQPRYDPPLPVSVVKEDMCKYDVNKNTYGGGKEGRIKISKDKKDHEAKYEPPLPVSVVKEDACYGSAGSVSYKGKHNVENGMKLNQGGQKYTPPLPVSVVKEDVYNSKERFKNGKLKKAPRHLQKGDDPIYEPPLPNSMLEIKSTRGKHSTEKPVALMEWVLKYYSKEGDVVFDPTMGSGSTGVACKNMNRDFIGIEKDDEIYEVACNRIYD